MLGVGGLAGPLGRASLLVGLVGWLFEYYRRDFAQ